MDIKAIYDIQTLQSKTNTRAISTKPTDAISMSRETLGVDTVSISPSASFQARLDTKTKAYSVTARSDNEMSAARMECLKIQYQGDCCPITGSDVASKMLRQICG